MKMDTLGVQAFIAIADHGSFQKAADALHITQTALTRRLQHLETFLGVTLVERTTRSVAMADRLQARFLRLVLTLGQAREATSWEQAALAYERGLDRDNLAEELYRRLMICRRERGRIAEAMNVYRRCRDNLSIILGVAPLADTVAIYNSLRRQ